tara:strand:- start:979 stop:1653 length:675 start_codon:yes stop_codon:yes gene_type:complete
MKSYIFFIICFSFVFFAQTQDLIDKKDLPNDVRWVMHSQEYIALCEQIYDNAFQSLQHKINNASNPVIVMDLDETVLDNSKYQKELFVTSSTYNEASWNRWVKTEVSDLVPGAKKFILNYKKEKNARIIYISNRSQVTLDATISNMKKLGIFFDDDLFLLRANSGDSKVIRRQEVVDGTNRMVKYGPQEIIAYFGDAIGDFPINDQYRFSDNKFIFPNPMYGKW